MTDLEKLKKLIPNDHGYTDDELTQYFRKITQRLSGGL